MTPFEFTQKWGPGGPGFDLNEEQGAQSHFLDLCELLGVPKPGSQPDYLFEKSTLVLGEARGYADVFLRNHFAWENKAPGKSLDVALKQLLFYALNLGNPPLLVVCDRLTIRIHTQFNGHPSVAHTVRLDEISLPDKQALLRRLWTDPESFRPRKTNRDITEAAAKSFATLADQLRKTGPAPATDPLGAEVHAARVAHFLTQCLFCFFAEDVNLLPGRMFERLVANRNLTSERLTGGLASLFNAMRDGGMFGADDIPWFNGGLFKTVDVPRLNILAVTELRNAANLNWTAIDVSIFGTLFERGLDPAKRSQLGAHYTDPATILRIIEPVVQRPLHQKWQQTKQAVQALLAKSNKFNDARYKDAHATFVQWLEQLRAFRVLDPACGSGNFLFLALKALKDIELQSHLDAEKLGLLREQDLVTGPHNVLGIELNAYAAELARVTVWIGELQWRLASGYAFKVNPVLEPLDHIACQDALVHHDPATGVWSEAAWPTASVVVGNPPFLGGSKKRRELGDAYFDALHTVYAGRVPGGADLVCYWFDKARQQIATAGLGAAGLVSTQSIRSGSNRQVLDAIVGETRIFDAWADEAWVNDGAAVRVSLVSFGAWDDSFLNGQKVTSISPDLSNGSTGDLTLAKSLLENANTSFEGAQKNGPFDISGQLVRDWLRKPNPHHKSNGLVLTPYLNASEATGRRADSWMVDFHGYAEDEARLFEAPFDYVARVVKPVRETKREAYLAEKFWLLKRPAIALRSALREIDRYIVTPRVAKHRTFIWMPRAVLPDSRLNSIARADDATFGILSSRIHEVWSLAQSSMHGVGNDPTYNAKSCFETYPFPPGLTPADSAHQQTEALPGGACIPAQLPPGPVRTAAQAIASAAQHLHTLRDAWLNPPEWTRRVPEVVPLGLAQSPYPDRIEAKLGHDKDLAERTLTKLYNQRPAWLVAAHQALDAAVASAYGWVDYTPALPDDTLLARLLALNLARAG